MSYTDINKISAQLGGTTIGASSTPSSDDVTTWISEGESEINERTGFIYSQVTFADAIYDWEGNDDILRFPFEIVSISSLSWVKSTILSSNPCIFSINSWIFLS